LKKRGVKSALDSCGLTPRPTYIQIAHNPRSSQYQIGDNSRRESEGIITDPIQARLGIHEKRLNRLIDSLENTLMDKGDSDLKLRVIYLQESLIFSIYSKLPLMPLFNHSLTKQKSKWEIC
jgi:hypothetical protein